MLQICSLVEVGVLEVRIINSTRPDPDFAKGLINKHLLRLTALDLLVIDGVKHLFGVT